MISFTGFILALAALGQVRGWQALVALAVIVVAFCIQFLLELAEVKHLIFGMKTQCPHCARDSKSV